MKIGKASRVLLWTVSLSILLLTTIVPVLSAPAKDTLVFATGSQITNLDQLGDYHQHAATVMLHVMEKLIDRTPQGKIVPRLSEKWGVSSDGLTWTFTLRRGIKFHDGARFDAHAVKATFDRITDQTLGFSKTATWTIIKKVDVAGNYQVKITTKEPSGAMLAQLTLASAFMMSPKAIKRYGKGLSTTIVGTGPYRFQNPWAPGQDIRLVRNEDYWGPKAKIRRVVVKEIREALTRQALLERGEVDVVLDLPPEAAFKFRQHPTIVIRTDAGTSVGWLVLNSGKKPLTDIRVRKAIKHGIDVAAITRAVHQNFAAPADNLVVPGVVGYTPDPAYHEYNPDKARQLLREAEYSEETELRLLTPDGRYMKDKESMTAIQGQLRKVGIRVDVQPTEWTTFLASIRAPLSEAKWDMYFWAWPGYTGDAAYNMQRVLWSVNWPPEGYVPFYKNPEVDKIIDKSRYITDQKAREQMIARGLKLAREDHGYIFLWRFRQITVHNKRVVGLQTNLDEDVVFDKAELR